MEVRMGAQPQPPVHVCIEVEDPREKLILDSFTGLYTISISKKGIKNEKMTSHLIHKPYRKTYLTASRKG